MSDQSNQSNQRDPFNDDCYAFAREFVALQTGEMREIVKGHQDAIRDGKFPRLDQKAMNQMALSVRKAQEIGKNALGEATERKQLDFGFGESLKDLTYEQLVDRVRQVIASEPIRAVLANAGGN